MKSVGFLGESLSTFRRTSLSPLFMRNQLDIQLYQLQKFQSGKEVEGDKGLL